nr:NADH-quinone oxidoreductase subunit I [Actinomycetota bacterium]
MVSFPGRGLLTGLVVTLRQMTRRSVTAHYPDAMPELPPRSRGVIALIEENCTSCMLCARECPSWCIYIDSHKDVVPATTEGGKDKT